MPVRDVVHIDEELCDGCGDCVPTCAEGAIQIVDGKARLAGDIYCDGLGACLGHCPQGAITVVRREAADFDEEAVKRRLTDLHPSAPAASDLPMVGHLAGSTCPGSRAAAWSKEGAVGDEAAVGAPSRLRQWPIQLHLIPPTAPFFADANVLLAADCVAYAVGGFHRRHLDGRGLAIACPKLDSHQEIYVEKLATMIDHGGIRGLEVMVMEVPCCSGLVRLAQQAVARSNRQIPVTVSVIGIRGDLMAERTL